MASSRCIRLMWADLPQGHGEQVQLLIADGLVGRPPASVPACGASPDSPGSSPGSGDGGASSTQRRAFWSSSGTEAMER